MASAAASLQSNVELVLGANVGVLTEDQRRLLESGWRNGRRLLGLIGDLHTVALVEAGLHDVEWERLDLHELVTQAAEHAWPVAHATGKPLRLEAVGSTHVIGAAAVLARSLDALVEHVVEQADDGGEIVVSVGEGTVSATYPAEGPVSPGHLPIALAETVARLHGGEVVCGYENGFATVAVVLGPPERTAQAA